MSKVDQIKERINYLKVWLGVFVITLISLSSWLINNYEKATSIKLYGSMTAVIALIIAVFLLHKSIDKKINSLEDL